MPPAHKIKIRREKELFCNFFMFKILSSFHLNLFILVCVCLCMRVSKSWHFIFWLLAQIIKVKFRSALLSWQIYFKIKVTNPWTLEYMRKRMQKKCKCLWRNFSLSLFLFYLEANSEVGEWKGRKNQLQNFLCISLSSDILSVLCQMVELFVIFRTINFLTRKSSCGTSEFMI